MNTNPESSLTRFVAEAKRYPMLTPERERAVALAWHDHGDRKALDELVGSHLRLVVKIARGYRRLWLAARRPRRRGQCRRDAGRREIRSRARLPLRDLRHVVDPRRDPGICVALLVARQDRHHGGPEKAVLQPAALEVADAPARTRRPLGRDGDGDRGRARRLRRRGGRDEPAARRRRPFAQRDARRRGRQRMDRDAAR